MGYKWNPILSQLDLVGTGGAAPFDPDTILTHALTPFGTPLRAYDTVMAVYYDKGFEIVIDGDGNVVTV